LLGCGLSTALGTVEGVAKVKMGESVPIVGCGGLGANLIRACKMAGAARIGCCDIHPGKEITALSMGATEFIGLTDTQFPPLRYDVVIETSGNPEAISDSLKLLGPSGRFIMVGHPKPTEELVIQKVDDMFGGEGKSITATQGGGFQPDRDIPRYIAAWRAGVLKVDAIVTHRFHLVDVNAGIALVRKGEASRVMIWTSEPYSSIKLHHV